ncbi:MAG: translation initiation factor IF-3 [Candidatus Nealsonbacteria bacterium]|nr:translation initiation factor IF-3 [Candidatus Nealsonbacteria bacterium]
MNKPLINNQIRAREVRVIGEAGQQLGVMPLENALREAKERNLDLIQVTERVEPPVCKIMDYGKYVYQQQKKEKSMKPKGGEMKGIRLSFNISQHDMEVRAKQAEKFLREGDKIRIEMRLVGRQKALGDFAKEKVYKFLEVLQGIIPLKIEREIKREPRGFSMIISKS